MQSLQHHQAPSHCRVLAQTLYPSLDNRADQCLLISSRVHRPATTGAVPFCGLAMAPSAPAAAAAAAADRLRQKPFLSSGIPSLCNPKVLPLQLASKANGAGAVGAIPSSGSSNSRRLTARAQAQARVAGSDGGLSNEGKSLLSDGPIDGQGPRAPSGASPEKSKQRGKKAGQNAAAATAVAPVLEEKEEKATRTPSFGESLGAGLAASLASAFPGKCSSASSFSHRRHLRRSQCRV